MELWFLSRWASVIDRKKGKFSEGLSGDYINLSYLIPVICSCWIPNYSHSLQSIYRIKQTEIKYCPVSVHTKASLFRKSLFQTHLLVPGINFCQMTMSICSQKYFLSFQNPICLKWLHFVSLTEGSTETKNHFYKSRDNWQVHHYSALLRTEVKQTYFC